MHKNLTQWKQSGPTEKKIKNLVKSVNHILQGRQHNTEQSDNLPS